MSAAAPSPLPEIAALLALADLLGARKCCLADDDAEIMLVPTGREIGIRAELDDDEQRRCWIVTLSVRVGSVPHDSVDLGGRLATLFYDTAKHIADGIMERSVPPSGAE